MGRMSDQQIAAEEAFAQNCPDWTLGFEYGHWTATHDSFEADYKGEEDGYVSNGLFASARTLEDLSLEIAIIEAEHPHFQKKEPHA